MSKTTSAITGKILGLLSILIGSIALVYFSHALILVAESVSRAYERADKILEEVDELQGDQIPDIIKTIDGITAEISAVRNTIPIITDEIEAYRTSTIPGVERRVDSIIQKIPQILIRVDSISQGIKDINGSVKLALHESEQIMEVIPPVMHTINTSVDSIHNYLVMADDLVGRIDNISKNAGRNTGSGLVAGIVTSPVRIANKLKSKVFDEHIEETDILYVERQILDLLDSGFTTEYWKNPETGSTGLIELQRAYVKNNEQYKKLKITFNPSRVSENREKVKMVFSKNGGNWAFVN